MGGVCIGLDSERAGSPTLEKSSRRDRDRVRFRGSNMNPKKKSRRCRGLGLDLAISRFIHSLDLNPMPESPSQGLWIWPLMCTNILFKVIKHRRQYIIPNSQGRKNYNGKTEYKHIHLIYINIRLDIYVDGPIIQGQSST